MEAISGRTEPLVRLWDKDFNLIYSGYGDVGEVIGNLYLTVDDPPDGNWRQRKGGRVTSITTANHRDLKALKYEHVDALGA